MTKQKPETDDAADSPRMSFDDHTIHPSRDYVTKDATPFTLEDYGDNGAFSEQTISWLAERHNLSEEQIRELSRLIGYSLDIDTEGNLINITRSEVQRRLEGGKLPKAPDKDSLDAKEANLLFRSLNLAISVVEDLADQKGNQVSEADETDTMGKVTFVSLEKARRILQPDDRRKERDGRRLLVVESCCYVALDAGWRITYTTDSTVLENQRGGRLIALLKDVIKMTSQNERIASVHTLKSDIETVRKRFERRGELPTRKSS